jgi:hypothetical protein
MNPWGTELVRWFCQSISSCRPGRSAASTPHHDHQCGLGASLPEALTWTESGQAEPAAL